jgi:putative ABC transport system permease protein
MGIDFERPPAWRRYLRFWGSNAASDVDEELRFHLESRIAELVAEGWSEEDARRATRERFGDFEMIRLRCKELSEQRERSMRRSEWLAQIAQDLRYGWRTMLRAPAFTAVAVLSLAVGIGANTAIFGLLHKVVLEKLPVPDPDRLVQVTVNLPELNGPMTQSFRDEQLDAIRGMRGVTFSNFTGASLRVAAGQDESAYGFDGVAGSFFSVVGVRPVQGRLITSEDDRAAAQVVVISESLWKHFWPAEASAVGKVMRINDHPFTVIGVTPASFHGVVAFGVFNGAIPLTTMRQIRRPDRRDAGAPMSVAIGRLDKDVTAAALSPIMHERLTNCCTALQGNTEGKGLPLKSKGGGQFGKGAGGNPGKGPLVGEAAGGVQRQGGPSAVQRRWRLELTSMSRGMQGKFDVRGQYTALLYSLMGGVLVLLLVACANVGTLLLARAEARQRELAVRYSLGAVRMRLIRQLLTESLQLALLGALLGYFLSRWGLHAFAGRIERGLLSDLMIQQPNRAVLGFTTIVTALSTVLFGVLPARRATRIDVLAQLKEGGHRLGGRRTGMLDRTLIVLQVALALLLVTTSGLLVQTLQNLKNFDAGFNAANLLLVRADFGKNRPMFADMIDDDLILQRIQQLPGVRAAGLATTAPVMGGSIWMSTINVSGYTPVPEENMSAKLNAVTPDYFAAAGIALRAGRVFTAADEAGTEPVAVVSETFVRRFLAGRNPVGVLVEQGDNRLRIIGVVEDARYSNLRNPEMPILYLSSAQKAGTAAEPLVLLVRTAGAPADLAELVQREMLASGQTVVIRNVADMQTAINASLIRERMAAILGTLFGLLALALAALGLYGVIAYQVAGRTTEIGTRMALGARSSRVVWLVLRQSIVLLVIGFMVGVPLALLAARALGTQLFGVRAFDPVTLGWALLVLTVTGMLASLLPARRATRVDPMTALRAS